MGELLRFCKNKHLGFYLSKKGNIWKIRINYHWKSRDRFSKDCEMALKSLSQKTLFDFGFKTEKMRIYDNKLPRSEGIQYLVQVSEKGLEDSHIIMTK